MSAPGPRPPSSDPAATNGILLTRAEYARYRRELEQLSRERDTELPRLLRDARTYVASDAIEEIAHIEGDDAIARVRMHRLQELLDGATVIPDAEAQADVVTLGRVVDVVYLRTGRTVSLLLTGNGGEGAVRTVSARSPVGRALMGAAEGDLVDVDLPDGRVERLRIVAVRPVEEARQTA